jgi:hypothetical protein
MQPTTLNPSLEELPPPPPEQWITALTDIVIIRAWHDPITETLPGAIQTASVDMLTWIVPSVGPICSLMAMRWASYAQAGPSTWDVEDIAKTFGIGESVGRVTQSITRLERFGIIKRTDRTLAVRLWLPPLSPGARAKLPRYLAESYPW